MSGSECMQTLSEWSRTRASGKRKFCTCSGLHRLNSLDLPACLRRFAPSKIQGWVKVAMQEYLDGKEFDPEDAKQWSMELSDMIKNKMKETTNERYKIAVQVQIGAMEGQGLFAASRCLWDEKTDNYASAQYYSNELFAVAMVFCCYYE